MIRMGVRNDGAMVTYTGMTLKSLGAKRVFR